MFGLGFLRCHYCSKQRSPFRVHQTQNAQTICDYCLEWHNKALDLLAGRAMPGCQACGATWEKLRDARQNVEMKSYVEPAVKLYCVPRDGVYQVLCAPCLKGYVSKRADLYRKTPFGASLNL